ncbi:MAG: DsbA family protein [Solirubrobacterales bacterium]|nr:DsbA family protein [Solirubrobacterales bacterium]
MARQGTDPGSEDLTRKQRREQARAQRRALEEAEAAKAVRRRRLIQLGGALVVVVAIIVAILLATGSGKKGPTSTTANEALNSNRSSIAEVTTLLNGIHQSGNTLGSPTAPFTLQYFGDLECPICREFTLSTLPTVIARYVRTGKLKIEYRSLETATREPETFRTQQVAAMAAGKQNLMWHFVELFYHEQGQEDSGYVTESYLEGLAKQVPGLDLSRWHTDRADPALAEQVNTDAQAASANGFTGTPSFLLGPSGGKAEVFSPPSFSEPTAFTSALEKVVH